MIGAYRASFVNLFLEDLAFVCDGCFAKPGVFGGNLPVGKWEDTIGTSFFHIWVG